MTVKRLAVLGATGSIGASTMDVVRRNPEQFIIHSLTGFQNIQALIELAREFRPARLGLATEQQVNQVLDQLDYRPDMVCGPDGLCDLASDAEVDLVMAAIVGAAGLASTMAAAKAGKSIALANKEALVMAGNLLMDQVAQTPAQLLPVDSEHNAIFQSLPQDYVCGQTLEGINKLWLTCSGGPFRDQPEKDLSQVTPAEAVAHPNWSMGQKISVDSATLMNKGLELIEACHLFSVKPDQVEVVIHPQSVIHSLVEYKDGSFISQLGQTDMRVPIANAMAHPQRIHSGAAALDLAALAELSFGRPDTQRFPALRLARQAFAGSQAHCIWLNAINECAVDDFLNGRLAFDQIAQQVERGLECLGSYPIDSLEAVIDADQQARHWYRESQCR